MRRFMTAFSGGVAIAVLGTACGGAAGSGGTEMYRRDLGTGTVFDIVRYTDQALGEFQYDVERVDSSSARVRIETRWKSRFPLADEQDLDVVQAMTKITVTARSRGGGSDDLNRAELLAENRVRFADSTEWRHGFITPLFREYVDSIADDIRFELSQGVRRF